MAFIPIERTSCLDSAINIDRLSGAMFTQENEAHQFVITCTQNNAQLTLTGTITAKVVLANGNTVELVGTIDGGKAVVSLTQPCYNTAGRIQISIFNTVGSTKLCIYAAIAYVQTAEHGDLIDGSQIIDSVEDLIADIQAAVATIPPDYSTLSNQVADLKSAFGTVQTALGVEYSRNLVNPDKWVSGTVIDSSTGVLNENSTYKTTDFIPCESGDVIYFTNVSPTNEFRNISTISAFRVGFYNANHEYLSYVNSGNSVSVPANAAYFRFTIQTTNTSTWSASINWYPTSLAEFEYYQVTYALPSRVAALEDATSAYDANFEKIDNALGYTVSRNLADKTKVTAGAVIDRNTGELNTNADYQTSAFIPCGSGNIVYFTSLNSQGVFSNISTVSFFRIGFYKEDYTYISCENYANGVTVPADSAFFRFSLLSSNVSEWCVTIGWYPTNANEFVHYKAPFYNLPVRVTALEGASQNPVLALTTVDCWGDSMTEGGSSGASYPSLLATALGNGYSVNNYGKSSQTSGEVAFRFGSNPVFVKLSGGQIPADTSEVAITGTICTTGARFIPRNFGNYAAGGYVHCNIEGVPGKLNALIGVKRVFSRDSAGDAVDVDGYARVWNDENFSNINMCIFWVGGNDIDVADTYAVKGTLDNICGMAGRMQHRQFIILPIIKNATEIQGTAKYNTITQLNNSIARLYPNNFLDIQTMLIEHGLEDAGITPTSADETAIANDIIPPSLMADDGVHPNEICRTVYVQYIKQFMQAKGWIA